MQGWGVEIEGVVVTVSYYGKSDHNRRGWFQRRVGNRRLGPGIGLFYFGFYLSWDQVYAVVHVTKKVFYGVA